MQIPLPAILEYLDQAVLIRLSIVYCFEYFERLLHILIEIEVI